MAGETTFDGFRVRISQDHLTAWLAIDPGADRKLISEEPIDAACADRGIIAGQDRSRVIHEAIAAFLADKDRTTALEVVIAKGRAPVHGVDGHIEFEEGLDPFAEDEEPVAETTEEASKINFYNQSAFTVLSPGQVIGRIIDPTQGVDGYDVTGKALGARVGRPVDLKVDSSVQIDRDQRLVAQISGIIEYTGARLRVLDQLDIANNVDFSTGNIDFPGDVSVGKGVKDCFTVKVGKSLVVRELVEAAVLTVAIDCTLNRGIAGRGKGAITTGRDLCATYLDNATLLVGRDLIVAKELGACKANVSRRVDGSSATLIGGTLTAGSSIEFGQVGSETGAKTTIVLGRLPEIDDLARRLEGMLPDLERTFIRLRKRKETLATRASNLSAEQAEEFSTLQQKATEAEMRLARVRAGLERLWQTHQENTTTELVAHKILYSGVKVVLGAYEATIKRDLPGPVRIWLEDGEPMYGPLDGEGAPLSSVAAQVETDRLPDLQALAEPPENAQAA